jgi:RNA polymerase sigma-70 factor, ECF subfamily
MSPEDFAERFREHQPAVARFMSRRVERDDVEDLTADVFAIAWRKRDAVTSGEELPWLYRIAGFVVANHRRKRFSALAVMRRLGPQDPAPSAESVAMADSELSTAWTQLSVKEREIISLTALDGLAVADAASTLGITPNAASIRLHRAKSHLAELLAKD